MKECRSRWWYAAIIIGTALLDRITKLWALNNLAIPKEVTSFLRFELVFNRGVSWGLFYSDNVLGFSLVACAIFAVIATLGWYAFTQAKQQKCVGPEVLVFTGALSNFIDRFLYGGVVDFILLHVGDWQWPLFNIADICIVFGVGAMLYRNLTDK